MNGKRTISALGILLLCSKTVLAADVTVPIGYGLIRTVLVDQLYTGANTTAHLWRDGRGCSFLDLSEPQVAGRQGQIRILNNVHTRLGTAMNGQCLTLMEWSGKLETFQRPQLDAGGTVLSFPITKTTAYDRNGRALSISQLQDLLDRFAEPKLASVKIDLNESRGTIETNLARYIPASNKGQLQALLDSLRFSDAIAGDTGLAVKINFTPPAASGISEALKPAPVFTEAEMQQWQAAWQEWALFLTGAINKATVGTQDQALANELQAVLQEAHSAFQAGLTEDNGTGKDPVRVFFNGAWERLAPVLRTLSNRQPGTEGLRYLTFIAATDVLYQLESLGAPLGLDVSSQGLRRLGRVLIARRQKQAS